MNFLYSVADGLRKHVERHEPRCRWLGVGRTVIASATLSVLLFTPMKALLVPVPGMGDGAKCDSIRVASALCIGGSSIDGEARRWFLIAILLVAASGYRPRWTAIPQAWATFSVSVSIALPDGGESVGLIMSLLMIPIGLADNRKWHWRAPTSEIGESWRTVSLVAHWAIRVQIAYIYLDSAIAKFGVADWANGTAEYYFLRDNLFGAAEPLAPLLLAISKSPFMVVAMTWGALVVEIAIAVCLLSSQRWRKIGLVLDIALHGAIIVTMGLWSFGAVMIGSAIVAALPERRRPSSTSALGRPTAPLAAVMGTGQGAATPEGTCTACKGAEVLSAAE